MGLGGWGERPIAPARFRPYCPVMGCLLVKSMVLLKEKKGRQKMQTCQTTHPRMISRNEFDKLFPDRPVLESFTGELVEWFANEANNTLGAIDHEQETGTWSYVVIERNQEGVLHCLLYTSPSPRDRTRSRMPSS